MPGRPILPLGASPTSSAPRSDWVPPPRTLPSSPEAVMTASLPSPQTHPLKTVTCETGKSNPRSALRVKRHDRAAAPFQPRPSQRRVPAPVPPAQPRLRQAAEGVAELLRWEELGSESRPMPSAVQMAPGYRCCQRGVCRAPGERIGRKPACSFREGDTHVAKP